MSEKLWQDNLALWQTQDKMNELHTKRIDELTSTIQILSKHLSELANIIATLEIKEETVVVNNVSCDGKKCRCGKVAH